VTGTFASGMRVAQVIADPSSVMITGPQRRVDAVEAATTDPVDASGAMTRASFVTQAYVPDPLIQVVHPTDSRDGYYGRSGKSEAVIQSLVDRR
jgi:hypothetical protein